MIEAGREGPPRRLAGTVTPVLPLALFEAIRAHDRPSEVLAEEDLTVSLPRRFGLTDVVISQIQRFEEARRKGREVPVEEVASLLRLVLRRPDAEAIFQETGQRLARAYVRRRAAGVLALRVLPRRALLARLRRAARRVLGRLVGAANVKLAASPLVVRVERSLTARIDPSGVACILVSGALEEVIHLYAGERPPVRHTRCAAQGDACCEWTADWPPGA